MARVLALLLCGAALAGTPDYRGRPLTEALHRLEAQGLRLLYSTAVVTDDLVVSVEPGSSKPRAVLEEILRPLGLASKKGPGGTLLIVRAAPPAPGRIQGRVVSEGRRRPVVGATVSLAGIEGRAVTDPDGRFEIAPVGPGTYTAEIAAPGFVEGTVQPVEVAPAGTAQILITLQALPTHVEEIVVTPGRHAIVQEGRGRHAHLEQRRCDARPQRGRRRQPRRGASAGRHGARSLGRVPPARQRHAGRGVRARRDGALRALPSRELPEPLQLPGRRDRGRGGRLRRRLHRRHGRPSRRVRGACLPRRQRPAAHGGGAGDPERPGVPRRPHRLRLFAPVRPELVSRGPAGDDAARRRRHRPALP